MSKIIQTPDMYSGITTPGYLFVKCRFSETTDIMVISSVFTWLEYFVTIYKKSTKYFLP